MRLANASVTRKHNQMTVLSLYAHHLIHDVLIAQIPAAGDVWMVTMSIKILFRVLAVLATIPDAWCVILQIVLGAWTKGCGPFTSQRLFRFVPPRRMLIIQFQKHSVLWLMRALSALFMLKQRDVSRGGLMILYGTAAT